MLEPLAVTPEPPSIQRLTPEIECSEPIVPPKVPEETVELLPNTTQFSPQTLLKYPATILFPSLSDPAPNNIPSKF